MAIEMHEKIRKALDEPQFWHLATVNPDGSPQVSAVWVQMKDGNILVNTALGRKKPRNMDQNPRVALSWVDPENGYHTASIQGRVVDKYVGDQADADIDSAAQKYLGQSPYPWRSPGEERVSYLIEPTHVYHQDPS
jgi:PPOX class probable F420-dependent enzyme